MIEKETFETVKTTSKVVTFSMSEVLQKLGCPSHNIVEVVHKLHSSPANHRHDIELGIANCSIQVSWQEREVLEKSES